MKIYFNETNKKLNKRDFVTIILIMVIYGILSFYRLGNKISPNTFIEEEKGTVFQIELEKEEDIIKMKAYNGYNNAKYQVYIAKENEKNTYELVSTVSGKGSFSWNEERLAKKGKFIQITLLEDSTLGELAFYNNEQKKIPIKRITKNEEEISVLTDEESTIPKKSSCLNSTYFDEIYFARTAYEYAKGKETFEWTHPPLGKLIQSIPIKLTKKMTPWNYRLMGNISGILMLLILYLLGKELFQKRKYAILSSLLIALDTFHFTETRIGTIDSHLVLFIMISIYFMIRYINSNKRRYFILSGLFFAFGIATKWTAFYGGIALAIIYWVHEIKNKDKLYKTIGYGVVFFIIIPVLFYGGIYRLFPNNKLYETTNIKNIIKQQQAMYEYHSKLNETHDFSSKWFTWPISYKPVWYHTATISSDKRETITGVGNIVIWWFGIISMIIMAIQIIRKKDKNALILLTIILSLWLPYSFINRIMFLYHYFPVTPFMILGNVYLLEKIETKTKKFIPIYMILVLVFFILYYPVISGYPVKEEMIEKLRIFSSWYF